MTREKVKYKHKVVWRKREKWKNDIMSYRNRQWFRKHCQVLRILKRCWNTISWRHRGVNYVHGIYTKMLLSQRYLVKSMQLQKYVTSVYWHILTLV